MFFQRIKERILKSLTDLEKDVLKKHLPMLSSIYFLIVMATFLVFNLVPGLFDSESQYIQICSVIAIVLAFLSPIPLGIFYLSSKINDQKYRIWLKEERSRLAALKAERQIQEELERARLEKERAEAERLEQERAAEAERAAAEARRLEQERAAEAERAAAEAKRLEQEKAAKSIAIQQTAEYANNFCFVASELSSTLFSHRFFSNLYELHHALQQLNSCAKAYSYPEVLELANECTDTYSSSIAPYIEGRIFGFIEKDIARNIHKGRIKIRELDQIVSLYERNASFISSKNQDVVSQLRALIDRSIRLDFETIGKSHVYAIDGIFDDLPATDEFFSQSVSLDGIDQMDGRAFEQWCADLLILNGFQNVELTKTSGDQGVDILAVKNEIRYAIQCKCYSRDLDNTPVQEIVTGKAIYNCQIGVVMTNRGFSAGAVDAARVHGVLLWGREKLKQMLSVQAFNS